MKYIPPVLISWGLQVWATARVAFKRLLTQQLLSAVSIIGIMIASGFILSVPLYADATYFRLLREELLAGHEAEITEKPASYAPLSFVFEAKTARTCAPG